MVKILSLEVHVTVIEDGHSSAHQAEQDVLSHLTTELGGEWERIRWFLNTGDMVVGAFRRRNGGPPTE